MIKRPTIGMAGGIYADESNGGWLRIVPLSLAMLAGDTYPSRSRREVAHGPCWSRWPGREARAEDSPFADRPVINRSTLDSHTRRTFVLASAHALPSSGPCRSPRLR